MTVRPRRPPPPRRRAPGLTAKQQAFVVEYCVDWNGSKAAERAGFGAKAAGAEAWRLLQNVKVRAAIAARTQQLAQTAEVSGARVLLELARIGFADIRQLFDDENKLRLPRALPDGMAAAVSSIEVVTRAVDEGEMEYVHKIKLNDKGKALELLGKRLALFVERVEHQGTLGVPLPVRIVNEHHPAPTETRPPRSDADRPR